MYTAADVLLYVVNNLVDRDQLRYLGDGVYELADGMGYKIDISETVVDGPDVDELPSGETLRSIQVRVLALMRSPELMGTPLEG